MPTDAIVLLVDASVRVTFVLAGGWALTVLMRRASASARHFTWMCTMVAAALMPAATIVVPDWHVASLSRFVAIAAPFEGEREPVGSRPVADTGERSTAPDEFRRKQGPVPPMRIGYATVAGIAWLAGVAGVGIYVGVGILAARRMRRRAAAVAARWVDEAHLFAEAFDVPEPIAFMESAMTEMPMVCGLWRPAIVMPLGASAWPGERLRVAVLHELAHVRRRDCLTQAFAQLVCAVHWFNPLVWLAARRLRAERERACDDFVLEAGTKGSAYATHLLEIARTMGPRTPALARAGVSMAQGSQLEGRLMAILNPAIRRSCGLSSRVVALMTTILVAVPVAAVQPQDQTPPQSDARQATEPAATTVVMRTGWSKQEHVLVRQKGLREFELTARERGRAVDRALVGAAADGDVEGVNDLLRAGANVDAAVAGDGSPLIAAARAGMLDIVQLLLDRGADPNMPVPGDGNAIIAAAREGRTAIVELLLQRGAYVDEVADGDENALIQASGAGRLEMVKLLVARGANVNVHVSVAGAIGVSRDPATGAVITTRDPSDSEWRSPLSMARRGGHKAVVEYLIGAGAQD